MVPVVACHRWTLAELLGNRDVAALLVFDSVAAMAACREVGENRDPIDPQILKPAAGFGRPTRRQIAVDVLHRNLEASDDGDDHLHLRVRRGQLESLY